MNLAAIKAQLEVSPRLPPSPKEVAALVAAVEEAASLLQYEACPSEPESCRHPWCARVRAWLAMIKPAE